MGSYDYEEEIKPRGVKKIKTTSYHKNYYPNEQSGICVIKRKDESVEDLIKRFRKKYSKSGLAKELRDKMYYEKPSQKRRRKRMQAIRMIQREEQKQKEIQEQFDKFQDKQPKIFDKKRKETKNDYSNRR